MAYDLNQAERVRSLLDQLDGYYERKMFGGICFMLRGNMCCGIVNDDLMLRLDKEGAQKALLEEHVREMDFTGKPMKTMVYVSAEGIDEEEELQRWVDTAVAFAETLPPKKPVRCNLVREILGWKIPTATRSQAHCFALPGK